MYGVIKGGEGEDMRVHCLFEQSGTFKNEFKKLGIDAIDYDIKNQFCETDEVVDICTEINKGYVGMPSTFDPCNISEDELVIAFFPCIRFTRRMIFNFTRTAAGGKRFDDITKLEQNIRYFDEMNTLYALISKLVILALRKGFKLVIENPYHPDHILLQFWHLKPKVIDMDRTRRGDDFKKPTQYWFINCEPNNNFVPEAYAVGGGKKIATTHNTMQRSLINKAYAERFIKEFLI
jgi:hypothetical protein